MSYVYIPGSSEIERTDEEEAREAILFVWPMNEGDSDCDWRYVVVVA